MFNKLNTWALRRVVNFFLRIPTTAEMSAKIRSADKALTAYEALSHYSEKLPDNPTTAQWTEYDRLKAEYDKANDWFNYLNPDKIKL